MSSSIRGRPRKPLKDLVKGNLDIIQKDHSVSDINEVEVDEVVKRTNEVETTKHTNELKHTNEPKYKDVTLRDISTGIKKLKANTILVDKKIPIRKVEKKELKPIEHDQDSDVDSLTSSSSDDSPPPKYKKKLNKIKDKLTEREKLLKEREKELFDKEQKIKSADETITNLRRYHNQTIDIMRNNVCLRR